MASERCLENLFWGLRRKWFEKSGNELVVWDILDDINKYKKYECLNRYERAELFKRAVISTDGEDTFDYILSENNGNLLSLFH